MKYTENLNLAKYETNDVTSYLEVSNANLTKIDAGHGALNTQVSANTTAIGNVQEDVNNMAPQVADANTKANASLSNIASVYDPTQTYKVGDFTLYNNNLYECNTPIPTAESFDGSKWTRVKTTDEIKTCKEDIEQINTNISTTSIQLKSGVFYKKSGNVHMIEIFGANMVDGEPLNVTPPNMNIEVVVGGTGHILRCGLRSSGTFICQADNGAPITTPELIYGTITWIV